MTENTRQQYHLGYRYRVTPTIGTGSYDSSPIDTSLESHCVFTPDPGSHIGIQVFGDNRIKTVTTHESWSLGFTLKSRSASVYAIWDTDTSVWACAGTGGTEFILEPVPESPDGYYVRLLGQDLWLYCSAPGTTGTAVTVSGTDKTVWYLGTLPGGYTTLIPYNFYGSDYKISPTVLGLRYTSATSLTLYRIWSGTAFETVSEWILEEGTSEADPWTFPSVQEFPEDTKYVSLGPVTGEVRATFKDPGTTQRCLMVTQDISNGESPLTIYTKAGLPWIEIQESWDGSVQQGELQIDDAYRIARINIQDSRSRNIGALLAKIAGVQEQVRLIPDQIREIWYTGFSLGSNDEITANPKTINEQVTPDSLGHAVLGGHMAVTKFDASGLEVDDKPDIGAYPGQIKGLVYGTLSQSEATDVLESLTVETDANPETVTFLKTTEASERGLSDTDLAWLWDGRSSEIMIKENGLLDPVKVADVTGTSGNMYWKVGDSGELRKFSEIDPRTGEISRVGGVTYGVFSIVPELDNRLSVDVVTKSIGGTWMKKAALEYGIQEENLVSAYAEFPDIRYCFETGHEVTPWIYNGGDTFINTGLVPNGLPIEAEVLVKFTGTTGDQNILGDTDFLFGIKSGLWNCYSGSTWTFGTVTAGTAYQVKYSLPAESGRIVTVSGTSYNTAVANNTTYANEIGLFTGTGELMSGPADCKLSKVSLYVNGTHYVYVPFVRNDVAGMLELSTMTFYEPVSGTMTYVLE